MVVLVFISALVGAMLIGLPIAYALLASALALMINQGYFDAQILAQNIINGANSYPLLAVPFFLLAGELMNAGGLSLRIIRFALIMVGHIKGGLGYVAIIAGCLLAALSGSAVADAAALTALLLPMMIAAGHDRGHAGGLIAASGVIAPVIPPSIGLIIFGVAGDVSISKLFLAGVAPGVYMGGALWLAWWLVAKGDSSEPTEKATKSEIFKAFLESIWALMLPVIILVGLRFGVFTPTEAAVVAAVYALFVAVVVYRSLSFKKLLEVFISSAKISAVVMFLIAASMAAAWMITVADVPTQLGELVEPFIHSPVLAMAALMFAVLVVGMVMDMTPTIMIMTPIFMPIVRDAGIDPVYFGVMFIVNCSIGLITPPVGVVLNTVAGVAKIEMDEVISGIWPFIVSLLVVLVMMIVFPSTVLIPMKFLVGN